jgi:DnaJ-class molecular chaperone
MAALRLLIFAAVPCAAAVDFDSFFGSSGSFPKQQRAAGGGGAAGSADREYYDTLGVDPSCTEEELKRAYKKRSLRAHPDRGGSEEEFKQLNEAYQVLSDTQKREAYDRYGKSAVDGSAPGGMGGGSAGGGFQGGFPGGGSAGGFGAGGAGGGVNMEELFTQFFRQQQQQRTHLVEVEISLEELYAGATKKYEFAIGGERKQVRVPIQPGMEAGTRIQVAPNLILQLAQRRHPRFERQGDNLHLPMQLSLYEALTGFRRPIKHIDGQRLWLAADRETTRPGSMRRLPGAGMPRFRGVGKGDLVVHFSVRFPDAPLRGSAAETLRKVLPGSAGTASPVPPEDATIHQLRMVRGGGGREEADEGEAGFF